MPPSSTTGTTAGDTSLNTHVILTNKVQGEDGVLTVRADSVLYSKAGPGRDAKKLDARFSITLRQNKRSRAAIEVIQHDA